MAKLSIALAVILALAVPASGEFYRVTVTRKSQDLYKVEYQDLYIVTRYCYEYAYSEDAVLKYDEYSYDNKLIFDNGECEVEKVIG